MDPLPTLITKEIIDEDDVLECKKVIYHLVAMESKNEALPVQASGVRKGPKRYQLTRKVSYTLQKPIITELLSATVAFDCSFLILFQMSY